MHPSTIIATLKAAETSLNDQYAEHAEIGSRKEAATFLRHQRNAGKLVKLVQRQADQHTANQMLARTAVPQ